MDEIKALKKTRGGNWSQEEKELFLELITKSAKIIENKSTETNNNKTKQDEWRKIQKSHSELSGTVRSIAQLKGAWRRWKLTAKKGVSMHRKSLRMTGGGEKPPSPTEEMKKIVEICPTDFIEEDNQYDSDAIFNISQTVENISSENNNSNETEDPQCSSSNVHVEYVEDINEYVYKDKGQKENRKPLKNTIIETSIDLKRRAQTLLEEEFALKMKYHNQELNHQARKQKMEIQILELEKHKKELEIAKLMMDN